MTLPRRARSPTAGPQRPSGAGRGADPVKGLTMYSRWSMLRTFAALLIGGTAARTACAQPGGQLPPIEQQPPAETLPAPRPAAIPDGPPLDLVEFRAIP